MTTLSTVDVSPFTATHGARMKFTGPTDAAGRITLNLNAGNRTANPQVDIVLHIDLRYQWANQTNVVVISSKLGPGGVWDPTPGNATAPNSTDWAAGALVNLEVVFNQSVSPQGAFDIYWNGTRIFQYVRSAPQMNTIVQAESRYETGGTGQPTLRELAVARPVRFIISTVHIAGVRIVIVLCVAWMYSDYIVVGVLGVQNDTEKLISFCTPGCISM